MPTRPHPIRAMPGFTQVQRADRQYAEEHHRPDQGILQDKDATSLKDVARTTAGMTLGTGEGGNAFGDRFFIRGFDARNNVSVDGIAIRPSTSARIFSPSRSKY